MKCVIKCECGCSVSFSEQNIKKISAFNCPACGQALSQEYVEKAKQCLQLIGDCKRVKRESTASHGVVDLTAPFAITFVEP